MIEHVIYKENLEARIMEWTISALLLLYDNRTYTYCTHTNFETNYAL